MEEYDATVAATRAELAARPELSEFIRYATLAASGHNTQPWRFRVAEPRIEILPDRTRRTPVVDPDDHHLFASLGCAAENLMLAAAARGRPGSLHFSAANDGAVVFDFDRSAATSSPAIATPHTTPSAALVDAIPHRQSTRAEFDGRAVSTADLRLLAAAVSEIPNVDLALITDRSEIDRVRDLVVEGNREQTTDPAFMRELKGWLRFSPRHALARGDGLFGATSGSPAVPEWLGGLLIGLMLSEKSESEKYATQLRSSAGVAVFVSAKEDPEHWVAAGRACERFALQATALGMKCAFINQPVEVAQLRPELAALVGLPGRRPDIVMRFGYGEGLPYSARRAVDEVLA